MVSNQACNRYGTVFRRERWPLNGWDLKNADFYRISNKSKILNAISSNNKLFLSTFFFRFPHWNESEKYDPIFYEWRYIGKRCSG